MALLLPGISRCCITGQLLSEDDEVVLFPPLPVGDQNLHQYSDAAVDFTAVVNRVEFPALVKLFGLLTVGKQAIFRNENGCILARSMDRLQVTFYPSLIEFVAPAASFREFAAKFPSQVLSTRQTIHFDSLGFSFDYNESSVKVQTCPNKYSPDFAGYGKVRKIIRSSNKYVQPFLSFLGQANASLLRSSVI